MVGQEHVIRTLRQQASSGHIAHAYLFSGSRGTTTTALNYFSISHGTAGYGLKGKADEVVLFTAARSAQDIRRRYAFEKGMLV